MIPLLLAKFRINSLDVEELEHFCTPRWNMLIVDKVGLKFRLIISAPPTHPYEDCASSHVVLSLGDSSQPYVSHAVVPALAACRRLFHHFLDLWGRSDRRSRLGHGVTEVAQREAGHGSTVTGIFRPDC